MISGHGSDRHNYQQRILADFSSNIWFEGAPLQLIEHLRDCMNNIIHYPEPNAESLSKKIALKYNLKNNNVLVTNGATEAFYMVAQVFQQHNSYIVYPAFAEYEDACSIFNHKMQFIPINHLSKDVSIQSRSLFWLGNPNNPDGTVILMETLKGLCKKNPNTIFVIDEAYAELCEGFESAVSLLTEFDNLIIIHSLTKTFSIPGIRLGYILASESIIEALTLVKIPWSVNYLALEAGNFILHHYNELLPDMKKMCLQSRVFQKELNAIDGLVVRESDCNYFLVQLKKGKSRDLKQFLIAKYGFLIRDASNFRGLDSSYFRVSFQKPKYNSLLVSAIGEWLNYN